MKNTRKPGSPILHGGETWTILGYTDEDSTYLVRSLDRQRHLFLTEDQMTTAP